MQRQQAKGDPNRRADPPPGFYLDDDRPAGRVTTARGTPGCWVVVLLATLLCGSVALLLAAWVKPRERVESEPPRAVEAAAVATPESLSVGVESAPVVEPAPVVESPPASESAAPEEPASVTLRAVWKAKVVSGTGVAPGTPCELVVTAVAEDGRLKSALPRLTCQTRVLYDSSKSNPAKFERSLEEVAGDTDTSYRYRFRLEERTTTEDSAIELSTMAGTGTVSSTVPPGFDVELEIDELSAEYAGPPLYATSLGPRPCRQALRRSGVVTKVKGTSPVAPGMQCQVSVVPSLQPSSEGCYARTRVRCGKTLLYGAGTGGFGPCTAIDGVIATFVDDQGSEEDNDPMATLHVAERTLQIRDERMVDKSGTLEQTSHTVEIRLDAPRPRSVPR